LLPLSSAKIAIAKCFTQLILHVLTECSSEKPSMVHQDWEIGRNEL
jgi:hypothetical protein